MRFALYSIRDVVSSVYLQPFVARSEVDAKRQLAAAFDDPQFLATPAGRYPMDFHLYHVGHFDDDTGIVEAFEHPANICRIGDLRPIPPASTVPS